MAGAGNNPADSSDYPYDASKYKGFWKYYNSETPKGRHYACMINLGLVYGLVGLFYLRSKFSKKE